MAALSRRVTPTATAELVPSSWTFGTDQHQALQNAERKAGTYGKTLLSLASLLCFWLASLWLACTLL